VGERERERRTIGWYGRSERNEGGVKEREGGRER